MRRKKLATREQQIGQALIEFALVTPALLFITMAIIDFGRVLFTYAQASNQVREALRFGALTQGMLGGSFADCNGIMAVASRVSFPSDQDIVIRYLDGQAAPDPSGQLPSLGNCGGTLTRPVEQGDLLYVENAVDVPMITPFFPTVLEITFAGQRTIVTKITLTESEEDLDFDGLSDVWECYHFYAAAGYSDPLGVDEFGDDLCPEDMLPNLLPADFDTDGAGFRKILDQYNATDDPDIDGCNNGCEETRTTVCTNYPNGSCFDPGGTDSPPVWADSERDYTAIHAANFGWQPPDGFYGPNDRDSDGDGLLDGEEAYTYGTDPLDVDSDDDGWDETACTTPPQPGGCPHNLEPEYSTGGVGDNGCQADDYEEAMGTPPHADPSSSRTAYSDDDPANNSTPPTEDEIEDGMDDWEEICKYNTNPAVINLLDAPPLLMHKPEASECSVTTSINDRYIGLQWSLATALPISEYKLYIHYGDPLNQKHIGTFPGTANWCGGDADAGDPNSCYNAATSEWTVNSVPYTIVPYIGGAPQMPSDPPLDLSCNVSLPPEPPASFTATPHCGFGTFQKHIEFEWTPPTGTNPIDYIYFYIDGLEVGKFLPPGQLQCSTDPFFGPTCFNLVPFVWKLGESYVYEVRTGFGSLRSDPVSFGYTCNP